MSDEKEPRCVTATAVQRTFGTIFTDVLVDQDTIIITSHGRKRMVLMPLSRYRQLTRREREREKNQ